MEKHGLAESLDEILKHDKRYDRDSYYFVRDGLDYTLKMLKKQGRVAGTPRHVSGPELLEGLRRFAIDQFGPMAKTVLSHWGVRRCSDFGEIVFNMVEKGILGRTEQDSRDDFKRGYDFNEAFVKPYQPTLRMHANRVRNTRDTGAGRDRYRREKSRTSGSGKLSSGSN